MPLPNASTIAKKVEFAGYGPAVGSRGVVKVQWGGGIETYRLTDILKEGILSYENEVDAEVQAVTTIVSKLQGSTLLEDRVELGITNKAVLRCHYLWMDEYPDRQKYLMDIVIRGQPRWHATGTVKYGAGHHEDFWVKAVEMLDEFSESSKLNSLDIGLVDFIKEKCMEAELGKH